MLLVRQTSRSAGKFVAAIALLCACRNEAVAPEESFFAGVFDGVFRTMTATVSVTHYSDGSDTLRVGATDLNDMLLLVRVPYTGAGTYTLGPGAVRVTSLVGGDVVVSRFESDSPAAGELTIGEANDDGWVVGSLTFDAVRKPGYVYGPAIYQFRYGQLRAPLEFIDQQQ
jgi:hypothetical protein